ncbi:MAG: DivIVA domain-containing protein [Lachnospiraceae bacterium]|nr:DivIVA domain-containing protein [Lachnospiraceae bacterium]
MLTAKDIREVKFNRSMGGYKTIEVDEFLDQCADVVEELTKQNEENSHKMLVLAETIVDYRNQEDSIRSALISAQRMSESIIADARRQADDILAAAQAEAETTHEKALRDTETELKELNRVKQEVADFKAKLLSIYREHLTMINILEGEAPAETETETKIKAKTQYTPPVVSKDPVMDTVELVQNDNDAFVAPRNVPDFSGFELKDDE